MKLLLYCTKAKPMLRKLDKYFLGKHTDNYYWKKGQTVPYNVNGKIVAECDFEVEYLRIVDDDPLGAYWYETKTLSENEVLEKSCLIGDELFDYLGEDNEGYAIHIKNLHIFDEPKELSEYGMDFPISPIVKAPQNMMYANGIGERYILISIKPQWLCKILNGEKTIEVRKKVLKEMLE